MTAVYIMRDNDDTVIYVGISVQPLSRLTHHERSAWFTQVATIRLEHFSSHQDALNRERDLIRQHTPTHNTMLNPAKYTTHCTHGHEMTPENTAISSTTQMRMCKECRREASRRSRARRAI